MDWRDSVLGAIERYTTRHGSTTFQREAFLTEELSQIVRETGPVGHTPDQTVSRVMQELRDEGLLEFIDNHGTYRFVNAQRKTRKRAKAPERQFGSIPGYPVGTVFGNRKDLSAAKVHRPQPRPQGGPGSRQAAAENQQGVMVLLMTSRGYPSSREGGEHHGTKFEMEVGSWHS